MGNVAGDGPSSHHHFLVPCGSNDGNKSDVAALHPVVTVEHLKKLFSCRTHTHTPCKICISLSYLPLKSTRTSYSLKIFQPDRFDISGNVGISSFMDQDSTWGPTWLRSSRLTVFRYSDRRIDFTWVIWWKHGGKHWVRHITGNI